MFTVAGLIEILKTCDPDRIVILSSDSEGNDKSPLFEICDTNVAYKGDDRSGKTGIVTLTKDLKRMGYSEEDLIDGKNCIVLYPAR